MIALLVFATLAALTVAISEVVAHLPPARQRAG